MDEPNQFSRDYSQPGPQPGTQSGTQPDTESPSKSDPGSATSRLIALVVTVFLATGIILWQNLPEDTKYGMFGASAPEALVGPEHPAAGRFGSFDLPARLFIRGRKLLMSQPDDMSEMVMNQFVAAHTPEDQVRAIIMSGEYKGPEAAINRIHDLRNALQIELVGPDEEAMDSVSKELVLAELGALEAIYTHGVDGIEQPMKDQLVARYGVLGQTALTYGMDDNDPTRQPLVTGFGWMMALLFGMMGLMGFGFLIGTVLLVLGITNMASGKMKFRFEKPKPGGSVFLETYSLFLAGFAVLSIGLFILSIKVNPDLGALSLPLQWILMAVPAWALLRGMKFGQWRRAIGLHSGEGVLKEIGCGIVGYLAGVPLFLFGVLISFAVLFVQSMMASGSGGPIETPSNPIFDLISDGGLVVILMVFALATVWAPITEELIFRGALFRHLQGRMHWVLAALASALLFAYMHSYGPLLVAPIIALGFMFACMRQWRGSIIAAITAHFIHNATIMVFLVLFVNLLKGPTI